MKGWLGMMLLLALVVVSGCSKHEEAAVEGGVAPDFTLKDLSGRPVQLSSLRGKVVLVNFWATWCPPCREEIPSMMKLNSAMAGKPFQMVSVSIDEGGVPEIESFFKTSGYSLPSYTDPGGAAAKTYGITGVPESFLIDKNGILVKKVIGPLAWDSPETISFIEGLMK